MVEFRIQLIVLDTREFRVQLFVFETSWVLNTISYSRIHNDLYNTIKQHYQTTPISKMLEKNKSRLDNLSWTSVNAKFSQKICQMTGAWAHPPHLW